MHLFTAENNKEIDVRSTRDAIFSRASNNIVHERNFHEQIDSYRGVVVLIIRIIIMITLIIMVVVVVVDFSRPNERLAK